MAKNPSSGHGWGAGHAAHPLSPPACPYCNKPVSGGVDGPGEYTCSGCGGEVIAQLAGREMPQLNPDRDFYFVADARGKPVLGFAFHTKGKAKEGLAHAEVSLLYQDRPKPFRIVAASSALFRNPRGRRSNTKLDREIAVAWATYQAENTDSPEAARARERFERLVELRDAARRKAENPMPHGRELMLRAAASNRQKAEDIKRRMANKDPEARPPMRARVERLLAEAAEFEREAEKAG